MTQEEIDSNIKLIATFMDMEEVADNMWQNMITGQFVLLEEYRPHEDWNELMAVVEKIESMHDEFHGYFGVHIHSNCCSIQGSKLRTDPENFHPAYMSDPNAILETKKLSAFYNISEFIKWHNQQTQQP